ncbi:hypothetical protein MASR2M17_17400 [Aminivibrio sp.]
MKILWITRKKGIPALLLFVVLFFLPLSSCCAAVPSPVAAPAPSSASAAPSAPPPHPAGPWGEPLINPAREWTIIAYLDGDNNLEESALNDLKEMEEGWPGGRAEVVVLVDRSKEYTTRMDDWTGTRAYRLNKSLRKDAIDSELLQDYGEMNLGDPAVLERYIHEALRKFPSPKAALFMWDHGAGWINMVNDDDAPGTERNSDEITLAEFKGVLEKTAPLLPRKKWDLLFFDMCLMGQAETVTACAPFADYMVAAAPTIPDVGMDYRNALPLFAGGTETAKIAAEFVKVGVRGFSDHQRFNGAYTAFDLSKTDEFLSAFTAFSRKLAEAVPAQWANITRSIFYSMNYGGRGDYLREEGSISSIDLRDWLGRLGKTMDNSPAKEIADLESAISRLIIATDKGPMLPFSKGLSIYAPLRENNVRIGYAELDFNGKTGWLATLSALYNKQKAEGMAPPKVTAIEIGTAKLKQGVQKAKGGKDVDITPSPEITPLSAGSADGSYVKLSIEGKAILWGYGGFAYSDTPDGVYTMTSDAILLDENLDPEARGKRFEEAAEVSDALTPVYVDGKNELLYQVGALVHKLANGEKSVAVTANYRDVSDLFHFTIDGTYSDPWMKGEAPAQFIVDTRTYNIVAMISIIFTENGVAVTDLTPRPEGIFRPSLITFDLTGQSKIVPGEPIQWGEGLDVLFEPIPAGKVLRILGKAESIGGRGTTLVSNPVQVKANQEIEPFLDATRRFGAAKLPGRYTSFIGIPQRNNQGMIMAPAGTLIEIKATGEPDVFTTVLDVYNEKPVTMSLLWEPRGLPHFTAYMKNEQGEGYTPVERRFALLQSDEKTHAWTTLDAYTLDKMVLVPLDELNFPTGFMNGSWTGNDGSSLEFGQGSAVYVSEKGARTEGKSAVKNNFFAITPASGTPLGFFFGYNPEQNIMVATFPDEGTAVIYNRKGQAPAVVPQPQPMPQQPQYPQQPQPMPQQPQYPQQKPVGLNGVWGAYINCQQIVMQIQGNQYQMWMNGMPYQTGLFQIQGNILQGQTSMGEFFSHYLLVNPNGMEFMLTNMQTGIAVVYQRMQ